MIDICFKILLSTALGFLIGLEREHSGKVIGIRTVSLIVLGSTLFSVISVSLQNCDTSRIIAQIVSGIGFLGAGVLIKNGDTIKGLTTSATIWSSAAVGCFVGIGWYKEAIVATIAISIINILFKYLKLNYD